VRHEPVEPDGSAPVKTCKIVGGPPLEFPHRLTGEPAHWRTFVVLDRTEPSC
jgi:hypothetical protein